MKRKVTHCLFCGGLIGAERGPAAKTCSPECQKERNAAKEKKRYQRVKKTRAWKEVRADYLNHLREQTERDPALAARLRKARRAAVRRHREKLMRDPEKWAEYLRKKRVAFHARTAEQKAARKYWYGSLTPDMKKLFLAELRQKRANQRLKIASASPSESKEGSEMTGLRDESGRLLSAIAAERRYEKKRQQQTRVTVRLSDQQKTWLDMQMQPGESTAAALRRLSGMPEK